MPEPMYSIHDVLDLKERQRLLKRLRSSLHPIPFQGCTVWAGGKWTDGKWGYSKIRIKRKGYYVHRLMYELTVGPIIRGFCIDHKCEFKPCCDPDHLRMTTIDINTRIGNAILYKPKHEYGPVPEEEMLT